MRITDGHHHFYRKETSAKRKRPPEAQKVLVQDYQPDDLKPLLDQCGVKDTVLVQNESTMDNTRELMEIAEAYEWIGAVVGWVDLTDPLVGDTLNTLQQHPKFKGVRHEWQSEPDPGWIMRRDVLRGLRELARRGLRFDLLAKPPNWPFIPQVARAVPDLPLVIDHLAKPRIRERQFDDWADAMAQAAEFPQMMCKLSGMVTEADWHKWRPTDLRPYIEKAIELFGVDRVMFGSDWPVCLLAASYAEVFDALQECLVGLPESDKAKILGENARRFYGAD